MQISNFNPTNLYNVQNTAFKGRASKRTEHNYCVDTFSKSDKNIAEVQLSKRGHLKGVIFTKPLKVVDAVHTLADTDDQFLSDELLASLHNYWNLVTMKQNLKPVKELSDLKVTRLMGIGSNALVFETTDGLVLKLTDFDQFPKNRKMTKYDLPLMLKGNANGTGYYLEEKVDHESLTQKELREFVDEMLEDGCELEDYLFDSMYILDEAEQEIKKHQFGRASDGKIYVIDPGCILKGPSEPSRFSQIKNSLNDKLSGIFSSKKVED